jgi:hypothetical protein
MRELSKIIDSSLPSRPTFVCRKIKIGEEVVELYYRDILECIRALFRDPGFAPHLIFKPEREYVDGNKTIRVYEDMHTSDWWWSKQVNIYY